MATRIESRDLTLRVEVGPAGISVTIDSHQWHWIVSGVDSSLHFFDGYAPFDSRHNHDAREPQDCPRCAKFLLASEGAGVNQREATARNKNVSGAANCGKSGARGDRAASSSAPISSKR